MAVVFSTSFQRMMESFRESNQLAQFLCYEQHLLVDTEVNYLTMRGSMISYLPKGKPHLVNDDGRWSREGRQEGKPGRVIRKIIDDSWFEENDMLVVTDRMIEEFSNLCSAYVMANGDDDSQASAVNLYVCNGEFIKLYYDLNYASSLASGNLSGSCMGFKDSDFFDIYASNPNVCSMVVALDSEHKVAGRALLWNTKSHGYCMDTIYASETLRPLFIEFAIKNNMRYKGQQSCHHNHFDMLNGKNVGGSRVEVQLSYSDFEYYPYVDTLYYLDDNKDILSNYEHDDSDTYYSLRSTCGEREEINSRHTVYDDWDDNDIDEDDSVYLDYRRPNGYRWCGHTHIDNTVNCSGSGRNILQEDAVYVSGNWYLNVPEYVVEDDHSGDQILTEESVYCRYSDITTHQDYARELYNDEYEIPDNVVELHDGRLASIEDDNVVELMDGRWCLDHETILNENGDLVLISEYESQNQ